MKVFVSILMSVVFLSSCVKQEIKPQKPNDSVPIITNPVLTDSTLSLSGQMWVVTKVLNTGFDDENRSDTLVFITNKTYSFNGVESTYGFNPNNINYTLTLNNTPWGHISGSIYEYNITVGEILNCQFRDYNTGQNIVKLWMKKI